MQDESWILYVDESGSPDDPDDVHVVAGLLLRDTETPALEARLRTALGDVFPLWPWPPHASELNFPASRVAAALRAPPSLDESVDAGRLRARVEPLKVLIQTSSEPIALGFLAAVERWAGGARLDYDALRMADGWLRGVAARPWQALREECDRQEQRMQELLSDIGARYGSGDAAVLVAASLRGSPAAPTRGLPATTRHSIRRDRYVRSLELVLERAALLLRGGQDRRTTWLRVATRDIQIVGITPRNRFGVPLYPHFVGDIVTTAVEHPDGLDPATRARLRLVPIGSPNRYDSTAHPGLVLADWIANRARRALADLPLEADPAEALAAHGALGAIDRPLPLHLVPRRGGGPLPTAGTEGPAQRAVRDTFDGRPADPDLITPRWARELARPWIDRALEWRS